MGVSPQDIIYGHPFKKLSHIRFAEQCGVSMMTFDCESELHKMKETCPESKILIRFRPSSFSARHDTNGEKSGINPRDCKGLLMKAKNLGLDVVGVSFHVGSDSLDAKPYGEAIQTAKAIFETGEKVGFSFSILDIGGGFPGKEGKCSFEEICDVVNSALDKYFPVGCGVKIIAEPGRYFACSLYTLVANVTTVKEIKKQESLFVTFKDGGPETGYMYYIDNGIWSSFHKLHYDKAFNFGPKPLGTTSNILFPSCIWGQTLDSNDRISKNCMLPKLSVGDWLYFVNMGDYNQAMCNGFNGFPIKRYTYYYVTSKTWDKIKPDLEEFDFDILEF